jgi:hypothetical protein
MADLQIENQVKLYAQKGRATTVASAILIWVVGCGLAPIGANLIDFVSPQAA